MNPFAINTILLISTHVPGMKASDTALAVCVTALKLAASARIAIVSDYFYSSE